MYLAQAMVGIFLPFFIMDSLGLEPWGVILWGACCMGIMGLLVYPFNRFCVNRWSLLGTVRFGLLFNALFLWTITQHFSPGTMLGLVTGSFILHIILFWPSFNALMAHSTRDGGKGNFAGNAQVMVVVSNLMAPIITGFLFEAGLQSYSLYAAFLMILGAIWGTFSLTDPGYRVQPFKSHIWNTFTETFLGKRWGGFICDAVQTATMWIGWGLYFQFAVGSYAIMGTITSVGAILEVISNKVWGKKTDKNLHKALQKGMWARFVDLSWRVIYVFYNPLWLVISINLAGNVLGPLFQVPFMARLFEIAEANQKDVLTFYLARELHLGLVRGLWLLLMALVVYLFGPMAIGFVLVLAGLSSFWVYRF